MIHTLWFIYLSILPFLPRWMDRYNLLMIQGLMLSWVLFRNECLVSLILKKAKDPNYVSGSDTTATDIKEHIGETLYELGRVTYKVSFLFIFLRYLNFRFVPQFFLLAYYLFVNVATNKAVNSISILNIILLLLIFNTPGAPNYLKKIKF